MGNPLRVEDDNSISWKRFTYKDKVYIVTEVHEDSAPKLMKMSTGEWVPAVSYNEIVEYVNKTDPTDIYKRHSWNKTFIRPLSDFLEKFTQLPDEDEE